MSEMKNILDGIKGRLDIAKKRLENLEAIAIKLPTMKHTDRKEFKK